MYITPEEVQESEEEKKKKSLLARAAGDALFKGTALGASVLGAPLLAHQLSSGAIDNLLPRDKALVAQLTQEAAKKGLIDAFYPETPMWASDVSNACFIPDDKTVHATKRTNDIAGVIAHELGHAQSFKNLSDKGKSPRQIGLRYALGDLGPLLGTAVNVIGHNHMTTPQMFGVATLSSLPVLPRLIEEFTASKHGYDLLRSKGKGRLESLSSFVGIPTYLAQAAAPFVPALLAKLLGKTADKKKKKKEEDDKKKKK